MVCLAPNTQLFMVLECLINFHFCNNCFWKLTFKMFLLIGTISISLHLLTFPSHVTSHSVTTAEMHAVLHIHNISKTISHKNPILTFIDIVFFYLNVVLYLLCASFLVALIPWLTQKPPDSWQPHSSHNQHTPGRIPLSSGCDSNVTHIMSFISWHTNWMNYQNIWEQIVESKHLWFLD